MPPKAIKADTLYQAAAKGNVDRLRSYLKNKVPVNDCDEYNMTLLHHAVHGGQEEIVNMLVDAGADCDLKDSEGWTAVHTASDKGNGNIIKKLIVGGGDVSSKDNYKRTPLHLSSMNGHTECVGILLEEGASAGVKSVVGMTALLYAASNGHVEVCKALNPSKTHLSSTVGDKTALQLAEENNHSETAEYLKSIS